MCQLQHGCGGHRTICRNQFGISTMWVSGMKVRPAVLAANAFIHGAILLACFLLLNYGHNITSFLKLWSSAISLP